MRSLIIHMSSSIARRPNAERLLASLPAAQLLEAVDGRDPAQIDDVAWSDGDLFSPTYPFPLRPAEIGVFQSHRKCWQMIVDQGWDYALIAEDDLEIDTQGLSTALDLVRSHGRRDMYIRLPVKQREKPASIIARSGDTSFILPRVVGLQCICQVVGRDAARKLLDATRKIDRPVDTMLQMHWVTGQPVHSILHNGNREIAGQIGGSTIQKKTRASEILARESKRAIYRAKVALRPQKP